MIVEPTRRPVTVLACKSCGVHVITLDTAGSEHVRFEASAGGAWLESTARMVRVGTGGGSHKLHECRRVPRWMLGPETFPGSSVSGSAAETRENREFPEVA